MAIAIVDMSKPSMTLEKRYAGRLSPAAQAFMKSLLRMNENHRSVAEDCLVDPYFTNTMSSSKLRALGAQHEADANADVSLWRGLKNIKVKDDFIKLGGTECAPMSTTHDLRVALEYSSSVGANSLLFHLRTKSSMERGADLAFLSAFQRESESLYKPLTYLQPTGQTHTVQLLGQSFSVVEVEPRV